MHTRNEGLKKVLYVLSNMDPFLMWIQVGFSGGPRICFPSTLQLQLIPPRLQSNEPIVHVIFVEPKIGGFYPPKWMVKIMEKPMNKWMIWGVFPLFLVQHPYDFLFPPINQIKDGLSKKHKLQLKRGCEEFSRKKKKNYDRIQASYCHKDAATSTLANI